jgi:5-methyltetrahydrofolate--homocysteine methyltransferase
LLLFIKKISGKERKMDLNKIAEAVLKGDAKKTKELVEEALKSGISPQEIINKGLISGMNVVGIKFKNNEYYIPEVLISARAMQQGMDIIKSKILEEEIPTIGCMVLGTVKGDLHDIGKNLVKMMFEGAGFKVIDLGIDVPVEKFIEGVKNHQPQLLGMSALLTTTMVGMKDVINALKKENLRDKVKIMVGGAPLTESYAKEIEADGYAPDAASAVDKAKELLGII